MSTKENQAAVIARLGKRITALKQYGQNVTQIPINGQPYAPLDLEGIYQKGIDDRTQTQAKRAEVHNLVTETRQDDAVRRVIDAGLRSWVVGTFGTNSQAMVDFGFPPPRARKTKAETKAQAVQKGQATRKARHTMGKKQKAIIKGSVPEAPTPPEPQPTGDPTGGPSPTAATAPKA